MTTLALPTWDIILRRGDHGTWSFHLEDPETGHALDLRGWRDWTVLLQNPHTGAEIGPVAAGSLDPESGRICFEVDAAATAELAIPRATGVLMARDDRGLLQRRALIDAKIIGPKAPTITPMGIPLLRWPILETRAHTWQVVTTEQLAGAEVELVLSRRSGSATLSLTAVVSDINAGLITVEASLEDIDDAKPFAWEGVLRVIPAGLPALDLATIILDASA